MLFFIIDQSLGNHLAIKRCNHCKLFSLNRGFLTFTLTFTLTFNVHGVHLGRTLDVSGLFEVSNCIWASQCGSKELKSLASLVLHTLPKHYRIIQFSKVRIYPLWYYYSNVPTSNL